MDQPRQKIREAKILLDGTDPDQKEKGREMLREVMRVAEGSEDAKKAHDLLADSEPRAVAVADPELDELARLWPSIQGFADYRLMEFLQRLKAHPGVAVPLRAEVIRGLGRWIEEALPRVKAREDPAEITALNDFVAAVSGVAVYEEMPRFEQLRRELFRLRLQETSAQIDQALKSWSLERAWVLLNGLGSTPDGFKAKVERLQEEVYEVDHLHKAVQGILGQIPVGEPDNWTDARWQAESVQQLHCYLSDARVPADWKHQLKIAHGHLEICIKTFIRNQALAAVTLDQLRGFWEEFNRLPLESGAERWAAEEDWFRRGLDEITDDAGREVERARDPESLTAALHRLRTEVPGLPPAVTAGLEDMTGEISRIAAAWRAMQGGHAFDLPAVAQSVLPLPAVFREEAIKYRGWLEQLEAATVSFRGGAKPLSEQVYQDGLRIAGEILAQSPDHALAKKLQLEANHKLACYHLDQALARWDLEAFFKLFEAHNPGEIYAAIVASKGVLIELGALTRREPISTWRGAGQWWGAWRATNKRLPQARPDSLLQVVAGHEAERRKQWYAALEALLREDLPPPEYEDAAASLEGEADDTHLQTYYRELLRKASIGRVKQHIRGKRFDEADRELGKLPPDSTDSIRLKTQLKVERALASGAGAMAEVLWSEWHHVQMYVAHPHAILLETIRAVWEEDRQDLLEKLRRIMSRVLSTVERGAVAAEELAEWETWLGIEKALLFEFSTGGVKQLANYLREASAGGWLDRRLGRLVGHWQAQGNTVMLAWAYQAFRRKSTVMAQAQDPADDLVTESDRVASQVLVELAARDDLGPDDLRRLRESLRQEERRWQDLNDFLGFLNFLPHPAHHLQPSPKFGQAKASLENLTSVLTSLARLKEEDLRQEASQYHFDAAWYQANQLSGVAARERLKQEFERWEPLKGLSFYERRIHEAAEKCGSEDPIIVYESDNFGKLADWVGQVIGTFSRAEAKGGAMWRAVSAEYCDIVYREACILRPKLSPPDLERLVAALTALHEEEIRFTRAIDELEDRDRQPKVPPGGPFEPERHPDYLRLIPPERPGSRKVFLRFHRCARQEPMLTILNQSRPHLPDWVREYLEKGVPECANER